jgi:DNA gyrase subunit B
MADKKSNSSAPNSGYNAENITVLEGLEAVRIRPGMYIGSTDERGVFVLLREVLDNSTDEAMAGYASHVVVRALPDNKVQVEDDGRGIPVDMHEGTGKSALEVVMTKLHAGGKFKQGTEDSNYSTSAGLNGVGVSCVNALSTQTIVEVKRNGNLYRQEFSIGEPLGPVEIVGKGEGNGTTVTYKADDSIFQNMDGTLIELDLKLVEKRLRELSYLIPGCQFTFENHRVEPPTAVTFLSKGGLPAFCEDLGKTKTSLFPRAISFKGVRKDENGPKTIEVEVALQYNDSYHDTIIAFGNSIHNIHGGLHESGFKTGLTRAVLNYAKRKNLLKDKDPKIEGDDVREGLIAIISVKVSDPIFSSQAKERLAGPTFIEGAVNSLVGEGLTEYLEENPRIAEKIIQKAVVAAQAREAAKKAKDLVQRKNALESDSLPGKLADCSEKDPRACEIFLVEGDSAGGSAKQGRDRKFQAILPLRGKIINVEKNRLDKILGNEEIRAMITAFGTGIADRVDYDDIAEQIEEMEQGALDLAPDGEGETPEISVAFEVGSGKGVNADQNGDGGYRKRAKGGKVNSAFDIQRLRYDRIIIMCDADVDGSHIRTLLLTFLFRYMRPLVEAGHIYIAKPPLYAIRRGKKVEYVFSDAERDRSLKGTRGEVGRFKGLGEMNPEELWTTTMLPENRLLIQVTLDDAAEADQIFSILMGDAVEPRKLFIEENAQLVADLDV